ncbi:helicase [Mycobacterium phage Gaia]|uniref:Helicase n=1 Tax=Mycobacterium phage Gaia TaxID=1486472 RepID=A0A068F4N3_9CAUD|nr:exonuclease [Mycobacterium phage Gaia]AID58921.1 helicase [Mycobacterium phage Gaia]AYR00038.1 DNA helicase [Mycobacterium phage Nebkiss]
MAKLTISGTIPVAQYANVTPSFDVEADTHEAAVELGLKQLQAIWDRVGQKPLEVRGEQPADRPMGKVYTCVASGTKVSFDKRSHLYGDGKWLSGSKFCSMYKAEFPAELISQKMADKTGGKVTAEDIRAMWAKKGEASSSYGTALHAALELYGVYRNVSLAVKGSLESCLHDNPGLTHVVEKFFEGRDDEVALYEAFVADEKRRMCGFIDRLQRVGEKSARVQDFKTNTSVLGKETILEPFKDKVPNTTLGSYFLQLSFYANILIGHGWEVPGIDVFHWDGNEWVTYSSDVVDISEAL